MWNPTHLQVTVSRAKDLKPKGTRGTNDAYATVQLGDMQFKTSVKRKSPANQTVKWLEQCELVLPAGNFSELFVTIHHQSFLLGDLFLGTTKIPLAELHPCRNSPDFKWYQLKSKPGQEYKTDYRGAVELCVQFLVKSPSGQSLTFEKTCAGGSKNESLQSSSSETGQQLNPSKEPRNSESSIPKELFKSFGKSYVNNKTELQALRDTTNEHQDAEDRATRGDMWRERATEKHALHESESSVKQDQPADTGCDSTKDFRESSNALPGIRQRAHTEEDRHKLHELATTENETIAPRLSHAGSPNPLDAPAKRSDSTEHVYKKSIDTTSLLLEDEHGSVDTTPCQAEIVEREIMSKKCPPSKKLHRGTLREGDEITVRVPHRLVPCENLSTERLVNEVIKRDEVIIELKQYIDLLVLRVMDTCPEVLLQPDASLGK